MKQQTLSRVAMIQGKGLHSGQLVSVGLIPAEVGKGIQFKRLDLPGQPLIKAEAQLVTETQRCSTLSQGEAKVSTVEHLMAACWALGIDNLIVELDGPELPILDGSSKPWVDLILATEITELGAEREYLHIQEAISIRDEETGAEISILPSERFEAMVSIDFQSKVLGPQYARLESAEAFIKEIAPCRTFVFLHEVLALHQAGLIKGGSTESATVVVEQLPNAEQVERLKVLFGEDIQLPQAPGLLQTELQFSNEAARHKLLDLIGDLYLAGAPFIGKVIAHKPGHGINNRMARLLREALLRQRKLADVPRYNPNQPPIYDVNEVAKRLQHRYPFLLVDKIIEISDKHVVGIKNVTMNEPFFPGHFPGNPVMPGVLQIEALAQTGGIFVLNEIPDPQSWDTYFLRIDKTRFRQKVLPGDTLIMRLDLTSPVRRGLCEMYGRIFVGETLVMEADLLAQIIKRK